jgi:hypothetical protein
MPDLSLAFATPFGKAAKPDFMLVVTDWHDMLQNAERHF